MRFLTGIVLFNPEMKRLEENISSVLPQVDFLLLVDNGSSNIGEVRSKYAKNDKIQIIRNKNNCGIATALNQIFRYASENGFSWVFTLDQDSVSVPGIVNTYSGYIGIKNIGMITCNIVDRNYYTENKFAPNENYNEIDWCITSGAFMSVDAYLASDGFDDKMFIDSVDWDMCMNLRKHGYKVIRLNVNGLIHEVGKGKNIKLFWKNYVTYNHPPFRQYYMARNHIYLAYKYPQYVSKSREIIREIRFELQILLYEKDKFKKIASRWKGLRDIHLLK